MYLALWGNLSDAVQPPSANTSPPTPPPDALAGEQQEIRMKMQNARRRQVNARQNPSLVESLETRDLVTFPFEYDKGLFFPCFFLR